MMAKATSFIFMLNSWFEEVKDQEEAYIFNFARNSGTVPFISQSLLFCRSRSDTYAELLKVSPQQQENLELMCLLFANRIKSWIFWSNFPMKTMAGGSAVR